MSKLLQQQYDEVLRENVDLIAQSERLLSKIEIAINEFNKIYSLANGMNPNEMIIRQKAEEALQQLRS